MELEKFVKCNCGKKKKIQWTNKFQYKSGEDSFCVGLTECSRCGIIQEHFIGNIDDIEAFVSLRNVDYESMKIHYKREDTRH